MRWHYRDALLIRLLPLVFALHIVEEWFGGFPEWMALVRGSALPRPAFIVINAVALALAVIAARAATGREEHGWMAIALATVLFVNAVAHTAGSLVTRSFSPGLVTGVVLYLPLAQLVLMRAWMQAGRAMFGRGVVIGLAVHAVVIIVAYAASM